MACGRIARNRRRTLLLAVLATASLVPFVLAVSFGFSAFVVSQAGGHSHQSLAREIDLGEALRSYHSEIHGQLHHQSDPDLEKQWRRELDELHAARDQENAANERLRLLVLTLVAAGLLAVLALVLWGLCSSPTSRVLSLCGARPASSAEGEVYRLLERLAAAAGLPTPRLYVIDSPAPNTLAAGMDPWHSAVAVTQGLLALLDPRELEGVLAHALSHIGNRDTRLNTIVAALALLPRLPYLLLRRGIQERPQSTLYRSRSHSGWLRLLLLLALLPVLVYVFVIAPLLACVIRSAISRSREFLADADAARLTRDPEGLLRALAKIRGAGSSVPGSNPVIAHLYLADPSPRGARVGLFSGNPLAAHPPIDQRITRLAQLEQPVAVSVVEGAVRAGQAFARDHPPLTRPEPAETIPRDELSALTTGNPMGRVYRLLGAGTPVYDRADVNSPVLARVAPGDLLVAFNDPGKLRQVITSNQTFGYIPFSVKLQPVDMLPAEVFDPVGQAAAAPAQGEQVAAPRAARGSRLNETQVAFTVLFGLAVFVCVFMALLKFGGN
ncbi:MAG: M48 family metalloprotease [Bryobacteraceae bacterium]|jgi:heat shock protein HtpX